MPDEADVPQQEVDAVTDDTTTTEPKQDSRVAEIGERVHYDMELLGRFLSTVFHGLDDQNEDDNILTWAVSPLRPPGYPMGETRLHALLSRTKHPRHCYYGTSTVKPVPDDEGRVTLRNTKAGFTGMHVIVLDDIGTKIPLEKIPTALSLPSYRIESSPGNYQYGYVLDQPVRSLDAARALVQIVYDSGFTDAGGGLATKLVRLPVGVNGKPGENENFRVVLHELSGRRFTPDELLKGVGSNTSWEKIQENAAEAMRSRARPSSSTPWSPIEPSSPSGGGLIDVVLEFMYDEKWVKQETNEWVTIKCPWAHEHTSGDDTAGYSPIGRGPSPYDETRAFKCFHDHCKDRHIGDLLKHVVACGGPEAASNDAAARLVAEWAYYPAMHSAVQVCGWPRYADPISMPALAMLYPKKVRVPDSDPNKKDRFVPQTALWTTHPARVNIHGIVNDPSTEAPLTKGPNGELRANSHTRPQWGDGEIDPDDEAMFMNFIEYLIPNEDERNYFLDWMAMKVVDPAFRGCGVLMTTPTQGTGRGTLAIILSTLLGESNTHTITFDKLVGDNQYNAWQMTPLVVVNETLDLGDKQFFRVYERLKGLIEVQPQLVTVNPKYGKQLTTYTHSSYLMFSNHIGALNLSVDDRRVYVISNPTERESGEYFTRLYKWLNEVDPKTGNAAWGASIYRLLKERTETRDMEHLTDPVPLTDSKRDMTDESRSSLGIAVDGMVEAWKGRFLASQMLQDVLSASELRGRLGIDSQHAINRQLNHRLHEHAHRMDRDGYQCRPYRDQRTRCRPLVLKSAIEAEPWLTETRKGTVDTLTRGDVQDEIRQNTITDLLAAAQDALDAANR